MFSIGVASRALKICSLAFGEPKKKKTYTIPTPVTQELEKAAKKNAVCRKLYPLYIISNMLRDDASFPV